MKLLEQINQRHVDKVPPGWLTLGQMADAEGYQTPESFGPVLREAVRLKLVERRDFRAITGRGLSRVAYYRYSRKAAA